MTYLEDRILSVTTRVEVDSKASSLEASGFFLTTSDDAKADGSGWVPVAEAYLVTNRHVLLPRAGEAESSPESCTFYLRRIEDGAITWLPVRLDQADLRERALVHEDANVDVAVIRLQDVLTPYLKHQIPIAFGAIADNELPGTDVLDVELGSDALIIGYPRGYHDSHSTYPIVKLGMIASPWGWSFEGKRRFLVDAKLLPGSSGSLVISRPTNVAFHEGQWKMAPEKRFVFLGVFSSKPVELGDPEVSYDLGYVWYHDVVLDVASNGVALP